MTLATLCDRAIELWETASGTTLRDSSSSFSLDPHWNPKHVSRTLSQVRRACHGEQLCIHLLSTNYASLLAYLQDTGATPNAKDAGRLLGEVLSDPEAQTFLSGAKNMVRDLLQLFRPTLGAQDDAYVDSLPLHVLQDADLAFVSMKKMQWASGIPCLKLDYNNAIPLFDTVEQLTQALPHMPNGFTLSAILERNPADSYFVLVFKWGENILLLTDMPAYADPLMAARLSSRNQRHNADRLQNSYLPYQLFSLEWSDNDRQVTQRHGSTSLQPSRGQTHRVLGFVADLPIDSLLWLSRLADLCTEHYLGKAQTAPDAMLLPIGTDEHSLSSPLPTLLHGQSTTMALPALHQLTRAEFLVAHPESSTRGGNRQWMEDAYATDIPMDALYPDEATIRRALPAPVTRKPAKESAAVSIRKDPMPITLLPLPRQKIYTTEEAQRAALYIGRHNLAAIIEGRALQDFVLRRDQVILWVYQRIVDNLPSLLPALAGLDHEAFSMYKHPGACRTLEKTDLVRQVHWVKCKNRWIKKSQDASTIIRLTKLVAGHEACCYLQKHFAHKEVYSDHRFILNLSNIFDLMNVTGLPRDAFPPCLRHYGLPQNLGNTILSTVDPVDLILDPWNSVVFTFALPVSRTAVNRYRKTLGLDTIPDAGTFPHYWSSSSGATALYDSLRQAGHSPVMINYVPAFIRHESSDQTQLDVDALNRKRRFVYDLQQQLEPSVHTLPLITTSR